MLSKIELEFLRSPERFDAEYSKVLRHRIRVKAEQLYRELGFLEHSGIALLQNRREVTDFRNQVTEFCNPIAGNSEKERSLNQPVFGEITGARGGIRTHVGLRQRILSPPPCLRLVFWPALPI